MTKVILATDGSQQADDAIEFLKRIPLPRPIHVEIVTNVFVPLHNGDRTDPLLRDFREHQESEANQYLVRSEDALSDYADTVSRKFLHGDIGHSIVEFAEQTESDFIVMGATGHSGIGRMLLGSVSDYVATHAMCNVIVARKPLHQCSQEDPMKITIGYNDCEGSAEAICEFTKLDWDTTAAISLLGVVPVFQGFSPDLMPNIVQYRSEQRVAAMRYLQSGRERLVSEHSQLSTDQISCDVVDTDHVGNAIIERLEEEKSDLIVIGDSHRSRISRMILGSVSRFVLHHAHCSMWIARDKDAAKD
ncbi:universal stress protein [Rhodopirellula maiorica SM1]|uniref:Universal stress protein n=1 Tax=Rhodopirellula maiorica SM1 TaxID=1265738 RepID=M5RSV9_9BACT|nr:universal stress protein [Rhodopirellula maiorica]EMI22370.1 universal stress protein [Rhodopirellula maiorica SM1]